MNNTKNTNIMKVDSSKRVDGTTLFNPMEKPKYNWGVKSYQTINEKQSVWNNEGRGKLVCHKPIIEEKEFDKFYDGFSQMKDIIYRGINNAKYKILTSLQVHYSLNYKLSVPPRDFISVEIDNLRKSHNYLFPKYFKMMDVEETDFLYLSLMQHYRAKTPFLDFSRSLDSALFFAYDEYEKSSCYNYDNPNNYVSLYWIEKPNESSELVNTINMLAASLEQAMVGLIEIYKQDPDINKDIDNLKLENYLSWSSPRNRGEGFREVELGFITERYKKQDIDYNYDCVLQQFQAEAKAGRIAPNSPAFEAYYNTLYEIIVYKTRLTNLNIIAQDGCFILYNPKDVTVPMEEFWVKNPTFLHLPQLHCIDIHKDLIPTRIQPLLKAKAISKETIYPNEEKIVSAVYGDIK